jgi:O-acetylserine/cysteine efflux transporter
MICMKAQNRTAILALAAAGALWGLTVPLSKLSLVWLGPVWLTVARFAAAAPLLAFAARRGLRNAFTPRVAAAGAIGFGAVVVLQNAGIERTSVSHAALLVGAVPALVALITASSGQAVTRRLAWSGYALALAGIALVAGAGGGGATPVGDLLVMASVALSAAFIVVQPPLLAGRDAAAVTAVQFAAGALVAVPVAALTEGRPPAPGQAAPVLAFMALSVAGTLLPFWLFAFGQARVSAEFAGAFVNLEPLVGAAAGWLAFGGTTTIGQVAGALAVLAGIALSTLPPTEGAEARMPTGASVGRPTTARRPRRLAQASPSPRASSAPISDKDGASPARHALARRLRGPPDARLTGVGRSSRGSVRSRLAGERRHASAAQSSARQGAPRALRAVETPRQARLRARRRSPRGLSWR